MSVIDRFNTINEKVDAIKAEVQSMKGEQKGYLSQLKELKVSPKNLKAEISKRTKGDKELEIKIDKALTVLEEKVEAYSER